MALACDFPGISIGLIPEMLGGAVRGLVAACDPFTFPIHVHWPRTMAARKDPRGCCQRRNNLFHLRKEFTSAGEIARRNALHDLVRYVYLASSRRAIYPHHDL